MNEDARREALAEAVRKGSRPGGLARACLLVAQGEYPKLDMAVSLAELRALSSRVRTVRAQTGASTPPASLLADVLGRSEGFRGAVEDYDDPENSYLNRVLARRRGLPILLSMVWVEVARGAGIRARGIPFPGHFAVFLGDAGSGTYVDPFQGGRELSKDEVMRLCVGPAGTAAVSTSWLLRATPRDVILRVLANLARAYEQRGDPRRLDRVLSDQLALALAPGNAMLLARRGEARARFDDTTGALGDLNGALVRLPAGAAFERVREQARLLARLRTSEN